jgi:hypothetical protein
MNIELNIMRLLLVKSALNLNKASKHADLSQKKKDSVKSELSKAIISFKELQQ